MGGPYKGEGQMQRDWEMIRIGVYDVKFLIKKIMFNKGGLVAWAVPLLSFCIRSLRDLPARVLAITKGMAGTPRLLTWNGAHLRLPLYDSPIHNKGDPETKVPKELNFPGNPLLGKRKVKALDQKGSLLGDRSPQVLRALLTDTLTNACLCYIISMTLQHCSRKKGERKRLSLVWSVEKSVFF